MVANNGIHRIDTDFYGRTNAIYIIAGDEHSILVDTGIASTPGEYLKPYLDEHPLAAPVDYVVNTHADLDHVGGNRAAAEMFPDSKQICHVLDQEWIDDFDRLIDERYDEYAELGIAETDDSKAFLRTITASKPTDTAVQGGESLELSSGWAIEILHAPGHSRGHLSLWDPASRALVIGDAVLSDGLYMTDGSPAFPPTYRYVSDYLATIDDFIARSPESLLSSHYPTMTGDAATAFLVGSRTYVERVEAAVSECLSAANDPQSLRSIIQTTAPSLGPWGEDAAMSLKFPILGHLEAMEARGEITRVLVAGVPCFVEAARA